MRRSWCLVLALSCLSAVVLAAPAHAGDAAGGGAEFKLAIDPFAVAMALGTFLLLLLVLTKFAWGPILKGLKAREDTIRKAVDDAQAASEKAQETMRQYEGRLAHAADEAKAILEEAKKDALALKASVEAEARQSAEATTQRAVKEIEQARHAAWDSLVRDAARLATETASRIVGKQLDAQGHAGLVDQVVGQIQTARRGHAS
jgi:F-type H+-transporting ATPase subunit b